MCYQERKKRCNIEVKRESQRRTEKKELQIGYGNLCQAPIVQKMDSTIHRRNRNPEDIRKTNCAIQWIVIYPVDSVIHLSNNWGQKFPFPARHTKETFGRSWFSARIETADGFADLCPQKVPAPIIRLTDWLPLCSCHLIILSNVLIDWQVRLANSWLPCLVPRPHYYARPMRFGSRGPRKFLRPSPGRSSRIRHRHALTERAWKDAV